MRVVIFLALAASCSHAFVHELVAPSVRARHCLDTRCHVLPRPEDAEDGAKPKAPLTQRAAPNRANMPAYFRVGWRSVVFLSAVVSGRVRW